MAESLSDICKRRVISTKIDVHVYCISTEPMIKIYASHFKQKFYLYKLQQPSAKLAAFSIEEKVWTAIDSF